MPTFDSTIKKIKQYGYLRVEMISDRPISHPLALSDLKYKMRDSSIHHRGWDYPHVPNQNKDNQAIYSKSACIESWIDWENFQEAWRLYGDGQFVHLLSLYEDRYSKDSWLGYTNDILPKSVFNIFEALYKTTEIAMFTDQVLKNQLFGSNFTVNITYSGLQGRRLVTLDKSRIPLSADYVSQEDVVTVLNATVNNDTKVEQLYAGILEGILNLCHIFQWDTVTKDQLKYDQNRFIARLF